MFEVLFHVNQSMQEMLHYGEFDSAPRLKNGLKTTGLAERFPSAVH